MKNYDKQRKMFKRIAIAGIVVTVCSIIPQIFQISRASLVFIQEAAIVKEYDATKSSLSRIENLKQDLIKELGSFENINEALPLKIEELNKKLSELEANPELKKEQGKIERRMRISRTLLITGVVLMLIGGFTVGALDTLKKQKEKEDKNVKTEAINNHSFDCIVDRVEDGPHGLFAFTKRISDGMVITCSCEKPIWNEPHLPKPGDVVVCSDVHQRRNGWCAEKAEAKRPPPVVVELEKEKIVEEKPEEVLK